MPNEHESSGLENEAFSENKTQTVSPDLDHSYDPCQNILQKALDENKRLLEELEQAKKETAESEQKLRFAALELKHTQKRLKLTENKNLALLSGKLPKKTQIAVTKKVLEGSISASSIDMIVRKKANPDKKVR